MIWSPANTSSNLTFAACLDISFDLISEETFIIRLYVRLKWQKKETNHQFEIIIISKNKEKSPIHLRINVKSFHQKNTKIHSDYFISFSFHLQSQEFPYTYIWTCEVSSQKIRQYSFHFVDLINLLDHKQRKRTSICIRTNVKRFQQKNNVSFRSFCWFDYI